MTYDIIVEENFSDDGLDLIEKIDKKEFESKEISDLKFEAEELSKDNKINELISYDLIKNNLEYKLDYQKEGAIKIIRDLNCTALLADEVGLGKTITAGMVIKESIVRGFAKTILILVPPSLVDQWKAELKEKFNLEFSIIENENSWDKVEFAIASIDRVKTYNKKTGNFTHYKAHQIPWDLLIVDEGHKLKARRTVRWTFVDKLQKKRFLILTATPFQNDLIELYNLLHLLKRGHLGTIKEFKKKFMNRGNKRYPLNPKELRKKLEEIMVRRKRSQTGINYKQRIPKIISVELTKKEKEIYDATCEMLKSQYFSANGESINGKLIIFAILPKVTSSSKSAKESLIRIIDDEKYHDNTRDIAKKILAEYESVGVDSKMKKLVELVEKIKKEDSKDQILIYTRHPSTLAYIIENLKHLDLKIVEFLGGLDREERTRRVKEFKNGADILISTDTGAEGLNFQFCRNLINYDLPWNPMSVEQRIGRLDRIGQKRDINIYSLATKDTLEEHVVDLIINKMCCVGLVIGELPIILFNLGLDSEASGGTNKIEELLMNSFIDSKNNLQIFSQDIKKIAKMLEDGIKDYKENDKENKEFLDNEPIN
jgi:SNF2 family DNA or RNA helicase